MKTALTELLTAARQVKNPSPELRTAITKAQTALDEKKSTTELAKLGNGLKKFEPSDEILFREDAEPENKFGIILETTTRGLLRRVAHLAGCPQAELPEENEIETQACDSWHGKGKVNLRTLADEITEMEGPFFSTTYKVRELQQFAQ